MDYSKQIEMLKSSLESYKEDEEKLASLYKDAIANAERDYGNAAKNLEKQYNRNRNEAYADTAREERNLMSALASRGLGFSGEAAQAKLNSNIILSNRLGDLTMDKNKEKALLEQNFSNLKSSLAMEQASKVGEIQNNRNKLNAQIAGIMLDKENADKKLKAEQEMLDKKLKAEMAMKEAELKAKYGSSSVKGDGTKGESTKGESAKGESDGGEADENGKYVPTLSAKELARQIVSTAGGNLNSEDAISSIDRFLVSLTDSYNMDPDYMDELLFILSAYGYKDRGMGARRVDVISSAAKEKYESIYEEFYDNYIRRGYVESAAQANSQSYALKAQLDYIYENSKTLSEFKSVCKALEIEQSAVDDYVREIESKLSNLNGITGGFIATDKTQ